MNVATSRDRLLDGRVELLQPISGYRAAGEPDGEWLRVLPPGRYRVVVSGVQLASGDSLASTPATLTVVSQ